MTSSATRSRPRRGGARPAATGTDGCGVVVLGMHRSGTSATTRAINLMGLPTCRTDDLWLSLPGNETGYWESASLSRLNEELLARLDGSWWCPPEPDAVAQLLGEPRQLERGAYLFAQLHDGTSWVWKDPRTCLTLPFWRQALPQQLAAVLVLRHPFEVSDSLLARNRLARPWSMALWERYVREALVNLTGMRVLVVEYAQLLGDLSDWTAQVRRFLSDSGAPVMEPDLEPLSGFVSKVLRHAQYDAFDLMGDDREPVSRKALYEAMRSVVGAHESFAPPDLPPESEHTRFLLDALRRSGGTGQLTDARARYAEAASHVPAKPSESEPSSTCDTEKEHMTASTHSVSTVKPSGVSPEWRRWLAENLMLRTAEDVLVSIMTQRGVDQGTVRAVISEILSDPCYLAGDEMAQRLSKLSSLLDVQRDLAFLDSKNHVIERRTVPTRAQFLTQYYARNRPVVLKGMTDMWPARTRWTPQYLGDVFGDAVVEVMTDRDADEQYEINSNNHRAKMRMSEYVDRVLDIGTGNDVYLVANNNFFDRPDVAALAEDFQQPSALFDPKATQGTVFFWFGPGGTVTPLHHDVVNVMLVQVYGHKRVVLVPALQGHRVYNDVGVFSDVDPDHDDPARHPLFRGTTRYEVLLDPGEALFIPVGWWHRVEALDVSISLSFTNFAYPNSYDWTHPEIHR